MTSRQPACNHRQLVAGLAGVGGIISRMANGVFKALAHPIRRGIVERLSEGSLSVGAATRDFGVSKPTISRHLKLLEEAGVVVRVIEGRTHRLALDASELRGAGEWIDLQRMRWERLSDAVDEYLDQQKQTP
jgi:DNA-binding transcriptional ArsR family regulator